MSFEVPKDRPWFKFWPPGIPKTLDYPRVPLFNIVEVSAQRFPDKSAIIYYGTRITYSELWDNILNFAGYLKELGIKKGDKVAIYMPNSPHWVIAYYGI